MKIQIALATFLTGILMTLAAPTADAGIAIAIAKHSDSDKGRDLQYYIRYDSTSSGYQMEKQARKDFKNAYKANSSKWASYPSTRTSGYLKTGHYTIIRFDEVVDGVREVTFALGFGATAELAKIEAIKELGRRNWLWNKKKGYTVDRAGKF